MSKFLVLVACLPLGLFAQGGGGGRGGARGGPDGPPAPRGPANPRAGAPIDLTGYWVSLVTEDWRFRMVTPPKGDYASVPINAEGRKVADAWDPAKDETAGQQCKSYGAAALMRVPGRLHITWQDDNTLKIETDAGAQTRLFHFAPPGGQATVPAGTQASWQGYSIARWEAPIQPPTFTLPLGLMARAGARSRSLE